MERHEILDMLGTLQLSGVRAAYDEIVPTGVKRQHSFERILGALLKAEIAEKHARSIRYQMGIAKLPLAKEIEEFVFKGTPINAELVRDLGTGGFLEHQRNVVLIGGTGSGKSHGHRHCPQLHPWRRQGPILQRRRPRQQARGRSQARPSGAHRRRDHTR
jgi:DNA replication protein DnaC